MLVHEIRNRTTIIGRFLRFARNESRLIEKQDGLRYLGRSEEAVDTLERLADRFSPLANRNFRRGSRQSSVKEVMHGCLDILQGDVNTKGIRTFIPESDTLVNVDPAELHTIITNLLTNAVYWLGAVPKDERELKFVLERLEDNDRVTVWLHDSGPGISEEDIEKVFWPGVTRKPEGIGMGLTLASELVGAYGGQHANHAPGRTGRSIICLRYSMCPEAQGVASVKILFIEDRIETIEPADGLDQKGIRRGRHLHLQLRRRRQPPAFIEASLGNTRPHQR